MCDSRFKLEMTRLNLGELRKPGILEVMSDSSTRLVRSLARVAPQRESGTIAYYYSDLRIVSFTPLPLLGGYLKDMVNPHNEET